MFVQVHSGSVLVNLVDPIAVEADARGCATIQRYLLDRRRGS